MTCSIVHIYLTSIFFRHTIRKLGNVLCSATFSVVNKHSVCIFRIETNDQQRRRLSVLFSIHDGQLNLDVQLKGLADASPKRISLFIEQWSFEEQKRLRLTGLKERFTVFCMVARIFWTPKKKPSLGCNTLIAYSGIGAKRDNCTSLRPTCYITGRE